MSEATTRRWFFGATAAGIGSVSGIAPVQQAGGANVLTDPGSVERRLADASHLIGSKADHAVVGLNIAAQGRANAPGADNSQAVRDSVPQPGGGVVQFPLADWFLNASVARSNVQLRGQLGEGEEGPGGRNALRPFDTKKPTVQFGEDTGRIVHNNGVRDLLISGYNTDSRLQAPAALSLRGGVAHFNASNFELVGGVRTLEMVPAGRQPVTTCAFSQFHIRNAVDDPDARAVYMGRFRDDNEYLTAVSLNQGHINGPTAAGSYTVEIDGGPNGITAAFSHVYCDMHDGKGFLVKGPSQVLGFNLQMDPGAGGLVIYETDQLSLDPTDCLSGNIRHGGQLGKNVNGDTVAIPADVEWFFRHPAITNPRLAGQIFLTNDPDDRFSQKVYLTPVFAGGPIGLYGAGLDVRDTTDASGTTGALHVRGGARVEKDLRVGGAVRDASGDALLTRRKTGWALDTGVARRTANATYDGTAEPVYTQATVQALMDAVRDLSQTVKALKDDLHAATGHGVIGT